ncbi:hypothetical protein G9A89_011644 [Geosiphon pyriformis]|nr:hypothetical protein G9A89_011644 [Geosiphon pyriformis]
MQPSEIAHIVDGSITPPPHKDPTFTTDSGCVASPLTPIPSPSLIPAKETETKPKSDVNQFPYLDFDSYIEKPIPTLISSEEQKGGLSTVASVRNESTSKPNFSFWQYLKDELTAPDSEPSEGITTERVINFLTIPLAIEKARDNRPDLELLPDCVFLHAIYSIILHFLKLKDESKKRLSLSQQCDLLKGLLVLLVCIFLQRIDASQMYHSIRGQAVIKLYVIFNVLEILDRLCCSFGCDIMDSLFCKSTLGGLIYDGHPIKQMRLLMFFGLAFLYILAHTMIMSYQVVTLNVAINSYSNALLTLLLSNQFIEIKGSVFKKFEKENLFQLSCADIVERFQLALFLTIITVRNLIELSGSPPSPSSILPTSFFPLFPKMTILETLLTPVFIVMASESLVDWLKHAFITKFNQIRPSVYDKFVDVLCRDLIAGKVSGRNVVDRSPDVPRRIGFAPLPLACLMILFVTQTISMIRDWSIDNDMDEDLNHDPIANIASWSYRAWLVYGLLRFSHYRNSRILSREQVSDHCIDDRIAAEKAQRRDLLSDPKDNFAGQSMPNVSLKNIERYMIFKSRIP